MIAFVILLIINFMIFQGIGSPSPGAGAGAGKWTVYGTMGCGWTRKQLEYMDEKGIPHTFVDCDKETCDDMEAFPTLVGPDGAKSVGFKQI